MFCQRKNLRDKCCYAIIEKKSHYQSKGDAL